MRLHTPPRSTGQTVTRSYGWRDGSLYRLTCDRAAQTERWHVADEESTNAMSESAAAAAGIDEIPSVAEWTSCAAPTATEAP